RDGGHLDRAAVGVARAAPHPAADRRWRHRHGERPPRAAAVGGCRRGPADRRAARAADVPRLGAGRDPRLRPVRREPPPPDGNGRDGVVRPRGQLRTRRLRRGALRDVGEGADARGTRRRAPRGGRVRRPVRLLLRAPVLDLLRDAHARLRPDRLCDRPPVVRRHGRRQRPARHLARPVAGGAARLLLPGARELRRRDRPPRAGRAGAVRPHAPGRARPCPAGGDGRDQHPAPPVACVHRRGLLRRSRRRAVRVSAGQRLPPLPGRAGVGGARGEIRALIGPNGAGKSTFFNILAGQLRADGGAVAYRGEQILGLAPYVIWRRGVSRTFQITATFATLSALENVRVARLSHTGDSRMLRRPADGLEVERSLALLEQVGLADQAVRPAGVLAYGDLKKLELAIALANDPEL